jgi:hypothetical protein
MTLRTGGWFLAMRKRREVGPYLSANASMAAARDLDDRLDALSIDAANRVVEAFIQEQRQKLATL